MRLSMRRSWPCCPKDGGRCCGPGPGRRRCGRPPTGRRLRLTRPCPARKRQRAWGAAPRRMKNRAASRRSRALPGGGRRPVVLRGRRISLTRSLPGTSPCRGPGALPAEQNPVRLIPAPRVLPGVASAEGVVGLWRSWSPAVRDSTSARRQKTGVACVLAREGRETRKAVQTFATTPPELLALQTWLTRHRVTPGVTEATASY
jgi:hypothetical protein